MSENKLTATPVTNRLLDSAVIVRCTESMHGVMLLVFLNAEKQLEVSGLFKEANLTTSVPKNNSAIADYVGNDSFEYIVNLSRQLTDKFEITKKLNISKKELGLFIIQTKTKQNNLQDIDKLTVKLAKSARSESAQINTIIDEKMIDCIAYFR